MSRIRHSNISIMEKRFESLTIFDFQAQFPDDKSCMTYLSNVNGVVVLYAHNVAIQSIVTDTKNISGSVQNAII
jgi:hypothetical protein